MKVRAKEKTGEVKITELERRIGDTPIAQKMGYFVGSIHAPIDIYVRDFLPKYAIAHIARTAREYLRERLVPDDD